MADVNDLGLRAHGVWYDYGDAPVLREVSFRLGPGEVVALAGPNGSGKTTLLRILTGALHPTRGSVTLDERRLSTFSRKFVARRLSVVPQRVESRLMFEVRSMVAMGRTPHVGWFGSVRDDAAAIERALVATDLCALADRPFAQLSGGEQQRVMLAMALAQEADYLLLDEPTVHLDMHHQYELLELIRRLHHERNVGVLAVMHDLNTAALYFDRIAVMRGGQIVDQGSPGEVFHHSDSLAVFRAPLSVLSHPQNGVPQVLLNRDPAPSD